MNQFFYYSEEKSKDRLAGLVLAQLLAAIVNTAVL